MIDRKNVIKALELEVKNPSSWECRKGCPYYGKTECDCYTQVSIDAIELLKEQEPVEPWKVKRYIQYNNTAVDFPDTYNCGNCGKELPDNAKYCPACGRAVKWDE